MKKIKLILIAIVFAIIAILILAFIIRWNIQRHEDAAVIQQIRTLNRWETASYTIEQIIDNGTNGNVFQQFLFGDRILLVAHGTVTAGFDLSRLSTDSISINGKSVSITIPEPQILSTSLDESQTRIYDDDP